MSEYEGLRKPVPRESIWSVKEEDRHKFALYFFILFVAGMCFSIWYEVFYVTGDSVFDNIVALTKDTGLVGAASITLSFTRFEGGDAMGIALDLFRKQKYEEAFVEGVAQGIAQGRAEGDAEWEKWFQRYLNAHEKGVPFDEPPPSHKKNGINRNRRADE